LRDWLQTFDGNCSENSGGWYLVRGPDDRFYLLQANAQL
jgi:hypothetical protein